MCTSPILVRVRGRLQSCPCGECDECLARKANDLYVRCRYEYDYCLNNGGCGFMCCITYSPDTLPKFNYKGVEYLVFAKKDIIDFIKRLRTNLDRFFRKNYGTDAPDFKYMITCEYGTDPTKRHQPHYHFIILFQRFISLFAFRSCFRLSLSKKIGKTSKRVFGYIFQCEPLDPKRGGIRYSGKYVLKDLMYESQRKAIKEMIKFKTEYVNNLFHIVSCPESEDEEFNNKCIRSTKAYKQAIRKYVLPFRHMLQFYAISNDLGASAIVRKYGENLINLGCLNFEGFPYAIPKQVKKRFEQYYGSKKCDELNRKVFATYVDKVFNDLVGRDLVSSGEAEDLKLFAKTYVQPLNGIFYLVHPTSLDFRQYLDTDPSKLDLEFLYSDFQFYIANDFLEIRSRLLYCLSLYDSPAQRDFRAKVARHKHEENKRKYEQRRKNNPVNILS